MYCDIMQLLLSAYLLDVLTPHPKKLSLLYTVPTSKVGHNNDWWGSVQHTYVQRGQLVGVEGLMWDRIKLHMTLRDLNPLHFFTS